MANILRPRRAFGVQLDNHNLARATDRTNQLKPTASSTYGADLEDQENRIVQEFVGKTGKRAAFQVYQDENHDSSKTDSDSIDERMLVDNMEAYKKQLDSILIDSSDFSGSNKENVLAVNRSADESMIIDQSVPVHTSEQSSVLNDSSVLEHSEISLLQHCSDGDVFYEYSDSIRKYMLMKERTHTPNPLYMNLQMNINARMRSILIDWMVDVADEYKMKDETLFLAINYIDRFLSKVSITRQEFQLLGTAALFIASKYEEIYPPELKDFVYVTDESFTKLQILQSERHILKELEFNVSQPTCNYFLEKFLFDLDLNKEVFCLSKYLCFLTTLECMPFLKYYPSEIALACIIVASKILGVSDRISDNYLKLSMEFEESLGKDGDVLQLFNDRNTLVEELESLLVYAKSHPQQAIQRKFSSSRYCGVANVPFPN